MTPHPTRRGLVLAACMAPLHARAAERSLELPPFTAIDVGAAVVLHLRQAQEPRVTLRGDADSLGDIRAVVRDGTLGLQQPGRARGVRIEVQVWKLDRIAVDGSASVEADALVARSLALRAGGSGVLRFGTLTAETLKVALGGSASLRAAGRANEMELAVGGSALAHLDRLVVRRVHVAIGGAGQAGVCASARLSGRVGGAGSLQYRGGAVADVGTSGSGRVRPVQA